MRKSGVAQIFVLILVAALIPVRTGAASSSERYAQQKFEQVDPYEAYQKMSPRFVVHKNGIVLDRKWEREWYVGPDKDTTWGQARYWVENLSVNGGGWRMPTREELKSLYRQGAGSFNMSEVFQAKKWFVWTGETVGDAYAWGFCFDIGQVFWPRCTFSGGARGFAVRSRR